MMKCMFFNANGLSRRLDDILQFSISHQIDITLVAETHSQSFNHHPRYIFQTPAYKGTSGGLIGGLAGFASSNIQFTQISSNQYFTILSLPGDSLLAVGYFPPSMPAAAFKKQILNLLELLRSHSQDWSKTVNLVGDFNSRHPLFGDHATSSRGSELLSYIHDFPIQLCTPISGLYTTINTSGGKGITDLLFSSQPALIDSFTIFETESLGGSDHRPLVWNLAIQDTTTTPNRKRWDLKRFAKDPELIDQYRSELTNRFPNDLFCENLHLIETDRQAYLDSLWTAIVNWITLALQHSCGYSRPFRNHQGMFWTQELLDQSREVNLLANSVVNDPAAQFSHFQEKRTLFNRYAQNRLKRHQELNRSFLDQICQTGNRGDFYKYVKRLNRSKSTNALDSAQIDTYAQHFISTFGGAPQGSSTLIDDFILSQTDPTSSARFNAPLSISVNEVQETIFKRLGRNKAAGEDGIPAEAYIYGGEIISNVLCQFFNILLDFQLSPTQWNHSLMCAIYKNKGDIKEIKNYRPISLTIVAKRIFEKIVDAKLETYKEKLHPLQGGFRKGRSTVHQVYYLQELMRKEKNQVINVYMDLRAAYDTVDRRILWTYLVKKFGMPLNLVKLLRAFFDYNESYLLVGGELSQAIPNLRGLPQGSSLSPTLFNFFIDVLIQSLESCQLSDPLPSKSLLFADDSNLHANNSRDMQILLDTCYEWAQLHGMTFAPEKCFVVAKNPMTLNLGPDILPNAQNAKYLGIIMDSSGPDWKTMATNLSTKAKNAVMALMKVGFNRTTWSPSAKIDVYKLFIRPLMEYGMQINLYKKADLDLFEKTQQLALRIAYGVPWNTSKTALKRLSCLESIRTRNHLLNIRFLWKLKFDADQSLPAFSSFQQCNQSPGSFTFSWKRENRFYHRLISLEPKALSKEIKVIRFEDIDQDELGHTNVSSAIKVFPNLRRSSILSWNGMEDAKIKLELIQWRLGRVAFHQDCHHCGGSLSRKHAVICSGAEDFLSSTFLDVDIPQSNTLIDSILNQFFFKNDSAVNAAVYEAIQGIRKTCLSQNVN